LWEARYAYVDWAMVHYDNLKTAEFKGFLGNFRYGGLALYYFDPREGSMASLAPEIATANRPRLPRGDFAEFIRNPLIVAIAYYLGAEAAFLIGTLSDKIFAPFWPPNVILFCALLITDPRRWWLLILATLPAHAAAELRIGMPILQLLVAFATNCLVALINALAVQHLLVEPPWFGSIRKATTYVIVTAFLSPSLCAFGGAFVQILGGGPFEQFGVYWARWYASNALGSLTLAPIAMIYLEGVRSQLAIPVFRHLEAALVAAILVAVSAYAFAGLPAVATGYVPSLLYLPLPMIIWAAVRFGAKGASGAVLVVSVVLIWRTLNSPSLFDVGNPEANVFAMQLFLIGLSTPILLLGAAIEEARRAETTIREREERISFAAATSGVGLWQYEFATDSLWVTESCRALLDLPAEITLDLNVLLSRVHPNDYQTVNTALKSAVRRATPLEIEFRVQTGTEGEHRWLSARAQPVFAKDGTPTAMTGVFSDVSSRKATEAEADLQRQEIAHLMRVSTLGELSGGLAHELTQPLTAILSNAQAGKLLLDQGHTRLTDFGEIFDDIIAEDVRAGAVIHRLRGLLRKGEVKDEAVNMVGLVLSTQALMHSEFVTRGICVSNDFGANVPTVRGDAVQLQQIVLNIFMNAMDAMENAAAEQCTIFVTVDRSIDGGIELRVADCGTGLPPSHEKIVFEPFFTTKKHGLGLGLSICASLAKRHGGTLSLQNNVSVGATAILRFPPPAD
jgi:PAS domain S-box-containing protein